MWRNVGRQIFSYLPLVNFAVSTTALWFQANIICHRQNELHKDICKLHTDIIRIRKVIDK